MSRLRGYVLILGAALFWGISATAARYLITRDYDTLLLVQMRITLSCILLLPYFLISRPHLLRVRRGSLLSFALLGVVGAAGSNFTYYFAIQETNVATAILMQYLAPVLVLLYAAVSGEERLTIVKTAAGLVSVAGCFLAIAGRDLSIIHVSGWGLASGLGSAFCWAFTNVWLRRLLKEYQVWTCIIYSFLFASLFWLFINPPWVFLGGGTTGEEWAVLLLIAVISVLIPHSLYFSGIRHLTASRAITTATFEPVVAIVTAAVFVGEIPGAVQALGAALVLSAIAILQIRHEEDQLLTPAAASASPRTPVHAP